MNQQVFPTSVKLYFNITGTWLDVSAYVVSSLDFEWGMGNGATDMVASTGQLQFVLNNVSRLFSTEYSGALSGFKKGIGVKLVVRLDEVDYIRFRGVISELNEDQTGASWEQNIVNVTVLDWLDYASDHKLVNPGVLANKRGDEVISQVLSDMPITPLATALDTGVERFPTVFDTVTSTTNAYAEFQRVAASEIGYVYLRKDRNNGETLVFENKDARNGLRTIDTFPAFSGDAGALLSDSNGFVILQENGFPILLNAEESAFFDDETSKIEIEYGREVINYLTAWAYPRKLDASAQILFQLNEPIPIAAGQAITIRGTYADPNGGLPINGQNMVTPVATTDYRAWTGISGTGTEFTASLFQTSVDLGSEGFTNVVYNSGTYSGYITLYNVRGIGIYAYNPVQSLSSDDTSVNEQGMKSETLHQRYQRTTDSGRVWADGIVDRQKTPRNTIRNAVFIANTNGRLMQAFLNLDVGHLIRLKNSWRGIDSLYYIQGIKASIEIGGFVIFKLVLRQAFSLLLGLSMLGINMGGTGTFNAVNYGYLPNVYSDNASLLTVSMWVKSAQAQSRAALAFAGDTGGGMQLFIASSPFTGVTLYSNLFATPGQWSTVSGTVPNGSWAHIAITYNMSSVSNDPVIYINGNLLAITEDLTPAGAAFSRNGVPLIVGNRKTASGNYNAQFLGQMADVRIYNRILTASEIAQIYNSGTPDSSLVTSGLKFQAFAVRTNELPNYVGHTLTGDMKLLDAIGGAVGTPIGSPSGIVSP